MKLLLQLVLGMFLLALVESGHATEPLYSQLEIEGMRGLIYPEGKTWVSLPRNEAMRQARRLHMLCSAIGGPVGRFRIEQDRLWLVGLETCSGEMPVSDIYPGMQLPQLAHWLSGNFVGKVGRNCITRDHRTAFETTLHFTVDEGQVTEVGRQLWDPTVCAYQATN